MRKVVHTASPIPTRIVLLGTERDLGLTIFACNKHITVTCNEDTRFSGHDVTFDDTRRTVWRLNPSKLHTKTSFPTPDRKHSISILQTNWLVLFSHKVSIEYQNHMKHANTVCGMWENADYLMLQRYISFPWDFKWLTSREELNLNWHIKPSIMLGIKFQLQPLMESPIYSTPKYSHNHTAHWD
jgi:hypothetical protein